MANSHASDAPGCGAEAAGPVETPDRHGAYPRLDDEQLGVLERVGARRAVGRDTVLLRAGDHGRELLVVLAGMVGVYEDGRGAPSLLSVHGPGRFLGELGLLTGQVEFVTTVMLNGGEILAVPVAQLKAVAARHPRLGDLILRSYLLRRSLLLGRGAGVTIVGSRYSPDT